MLGANEYIVVKVRRSPASCVCQRFLSISEACIYCWVLMGWIWVLISRMPSLANLSPLYKHKSRNVISVVENSAVKLMRSCKPLMLLMNRSSLSFVSVHARNISSIYLFQCVGEEFVSERIPDSSVPMKMLA